MTGASAAARAQDKHGTAGRSALACCQIALSAGDIARSHWWYRNALGFLAAGERRHREGEQWAAVPGLPEASFDVWCLVGRQRFCQIEMFEFTRPRPRPLPVEHQLRDLGYSMFGIHVNDLDRAIARIERFGGAPLTAPVGAAGARRVCVRDPDGVLLELMEDGAFTDAASDVIDEPGVPALASATISVRSLERVRTFWGDVLGLEEAPPIHGPEHELLWGSDGASRKSIVLRAGEMALEFVHYSSPPGRSRPAGYLLSDHGVLNVALGSTNKHEFHAVYERAASAGFRGHTDPWNVPGVATVVYLQDPQGLSVELLHVEAEALDRMGFRAARQTAAVSLARAAR